MADDIVDDLEHALVADRCPWDVTLYQRSIDEIKQLRARVDERSRYVNGEMERVALATMNSDLRSELLLAQQEIEQHLRTVERQMGSISQMAHMLYDKDKQIERLQIQLDLCRG